MKRLATFINGPRTAEVHTTDAGTHLVQGNTARIAETANLLEALRAARRWVDEREHAATG